MGMKINGNAFNVAIASFAAGSVAFATYAMPNDLFGRIVGATGLPAFIPAAQPPLGVTARLGALGVGAVVTFVVVWLLLRAFDAPKAKAPVEHQDDDDFLDDDWVAPRLRRADAHPDAPFRRPLLAGRELGEPENGPEQEGSPTDEGGEAIGPSEVASSHNEIPAFLSASPELDAQESEHSVEAKDSFEPVFSADVEERLDVPEPEAAEDEHEADGESFGPVFAEDPELSTDTWLEDAVEGEQAVDSENFDSVFGIDTEASPPADHDFDQVPTEAHEPVWPSAEIDQPETLEPWRPAATVSPPTELDDPLELGAFEESPGESDHEQERASAEQELNGATEPASVVELRYPGDQEAPSADDLMARLPLPEAKGDSISSLLMRLDAGVSECEWPLPATQTGEPGAAGDDRLRNVLDDLQKMASRGS